MLLNHREAVALADPGATVRHRRLPEIPLFPRWPKTHTPPSHEAVPTDTEQAGHLCKTGAPRVFCQARNTSATLQA